MDISKYSTKKSIAQGLLDISLLTANISQLKYVLQVGNRHEFYTLILTLLSISIFLQASISFNILLKQSCCVSVAVRLKCTFIHTHTGHAYTDTYWSDSGKWYELSLVTTSMWYLSCTFDVVVGDHIRWKISLNFVLNTIAGGNYYALLWQRWNRISTKYICC